MRADDPSRAITDHHVGLGASSRLGRRQDRQETLSGDFTTRPKGGGPDRTKARVGRFSRHDEVKRSLTVLIFSGVLERFPRLKIVSAENNVSWLPFVIQRWDQAFEAFRYMYPTPLALPPSEYFRRQVSATYIDDPLAVQYRHEVGIDHVMWSSNFPLRRTGDSLRPLSGTFSDGV